MTQHWKHANETIDGKTFKITGTYPGEDTVFITTYRDTFVEAKIQSWRLIGRGFNTSITQVEK